ncbi:MAG: flippase-like domain-containing protein [Spirochaetales bacterium]|nr:flippase-like domain-containing protein [Spirochaetales bacterium]
MKNKEKKVKKSKQSRNLMIFLVMTIVLFVTIIAVTASDGTVQYLAEYKIEYFFYLLALWFLSYTADAVALLFFTKGTGEKISIMNSYRATAVKVYFNVITPFTAGGQPMMVYAMNSYGVPPGKGSSIVVTKLITVAIWNFIGAVTCLTFFRNLITTSNALNIVFFISGIFFTVGIGSGIIALLSPWFQHKFGKCLTFLGSKVRLIKDPKKAEEFINKEAFLTRKSFKEYFSRKGFAFFTLGCLANLVMYTSHVSIMLLLLKGFGIEFGLLEGIVKSAVLIFSLSFVPVPAGLLGGEASYWIIFNQMISDDIKGIIVLMWRLGLQFLTAGIGGIVTARHFSKAMKDTNEIKELEPAKILLKEGEINE